MDEEMDWLQTIKQSQDGKKSTLKLSAERILQSKMCSLFRGHKLWARAN